MQVTSPNAVKELLSRNGLNPLKKFGQNFLIDQNIVNKIAEAASPENSSVLEIGPGLGALTNALCLREKKVVAVEIDRGLVRLAEETQSEHKNLTVIEEDFLNINLEELAGKYFGGSFYVCGNLPYYITAPIIMKVLESKTPVLALTAMVQKEVAERLSAKPGQTDYGIITATVDYFGGAQTLFTVSKNCFYPAPKVDSAVIKINVDKSKDKEVPFGEYGKVVKAAFAMRRKTILNNLKAIFGNNALRVLTECNINPAARAQDLSCSEFINIALRAQKYAKESI